MDGIELQSTPAAIVIYNAGDGSSAIIATITNSTAVQISTNQVLYNQAFAGICGASVVYTIERGTFHQDVIFTGKLDPSAWGFSTNDPLRIQVYTEFFGQIPEPDLMVQPVYVEKDQTVRSLMVSADLMDQTIGFGNLVFGTGRAYTTPTPGNPLGSGVIVAKEITTTPEGRNFLVETVDFDSIHELLDLPDCSPSSGSAKVERSKANLYARIPRPRYKPGHNEVGGSDLADFNKPQGKPAGVTIDYIANIGGSLTQTITFASSTNYFVNGGVFCNGPTVFEPSIFKFPTNTAYIQLNNTVTCKTSSYRPCVFTAVDDSTIGDSFATWPGANYTGIINPNGYANPAIYMNQTTLTLNNFRICYAKQAIRYASPSPYTLATLTVNHSQFVNCIRGIELDNGGSGSSSGTGTIAVNLNNTLLAGVKTPVMGGGLWNPVNLSLINCTVDQATKLVDGSWNGSLSFNSINSIYANITNRTYSVSLMGNNNGFYVAQSFGSSQFTNATSPFQHVGAGNYYLSAAFRGVGTNYGVPSWLQSDLGQRTTYPPIVLASTNITSNVTFTPQAPRNTGGLDLGAHYDPVDYALGDVSLSNAVASAYGGVVLATFNTNGSPYGLRVSAAGQLLCTGLCTNRNWLVRYNMVQEEPYTNWSGIPAASSLAADWTSNAPSSIINCRFTDFSIPAQDGYHFYAYTNTPGTLPVNFQDCQFHGGEFASGFATVNLTNNLFERVSLVLTIQDSNIPYIRNNLFWNGSFAIHLKGSTNGVIRENLFDETLITDSGNTYTGGYNGYITNASRLSMSDSTDVILTNSPAYQSGALGAYYLPSNSLLINAGSQPADLSGLYFYCTTTNQVLETNSIVDIGYHYAVPGSFEQTMDSDGDGLPDWWEILYGLDPNNPDTGNTGISDGYKQDSAGDGWSNLQKYQMGIPPNVFITPPAPQGFSSVINSGGGSATLTWQTNNGPVISYTIVRYDDNLPTLTNTVSASQSSFIDGSSPADDVTTYTVTANYSGGASPLSEVENPIIDPDYTVEAQAVRGPGGALFLAAPAIPQDVTAIRVYYTLASMAYPEWNFELQPLEYYSPPISGPGYLDVPVSEFVNGVHQITTNELSPYGAYALSLRGVGPSGKLGNIADNGGQPLYNIPFLDGRPHIKQNINFLLQAPNAKFAFDFYVSGNGGANDFKYAQYGATNYVFSGIFANPASLREILLNEFEPFEENYLYANFTYPNEANINYEIWPFIGPWLSLATTTLFGTFNFIPGMTAPPLAPNWYQNSAAWTISSDGDVWGDDTAESGFYVDPNNSQNRILSTTAVNIYGLPFQTVLASNVTVRPGNSVPLTDFQSSFPFQQIALPSLTNQTYYFARPSIEPLPGQGSFSTTNASPAVMVIPFGQPFSITGWAKQALNNGFSDVYAYAGQYFDKAFLADSNGNITTNQTGILSEYGEFLPTLPGKVFLTTKPDGATGSTNQCAVYVIKLALDVNHDGVMDLTLGGPDNTCLDRPFSFWANNDYDRLWKDADDGVYYDDSVTAVRGNLTPDCNYHDYTGARAIPCQRDLQDFTRLWVCGITSNLLSALPPSSTVTLDWGDVGNPNPSNPTIDLFPAEEEDGGIAYLTNSTDALLQTASSVYPYTGRLGPGQQIQLNGSQFTNGWAGNYFIWCGVSNGTGALTLTVSQGGTNVLAQTRVYIQTVDIKQMYERWTVGDDPAVAPTKIASLAQDDCAVQFVYGSSLNTNTPYILYVHGWNMDRYDKDRFAESAFKRLYWQGYHGRFGSFRWTTTYGFSGSYWQALTDPENYDNGEFQAWQSAQGLANELNDLNSKYPGHVYVLAHSMGNIVTGEALRLAAQNGSGQIANTYVASQAALSAHNYDATVTTPYLLPFTYKYPSGFLSLLGTNNYGPYAPDIYVNRLTNNLVAVGKRMSFYNVNDFALAMPRWGFDSILRPDHPLGGYYYYSGSTGDPSPWNHFEFIFTTGDPPPSPTYFDIVNSLHDRYEVMAYAAPSYSTALGATPNVLNISQNLDLTTVWPPDTSGHSYSDHFWHSAEFRGDYWQEQGYWHTLLFSSTYGFNITP